MITRRRMISILAGAAALPVLGTVANASVVNWRGVALGANANIVLDHPNADALLDSALQEIARLEKVFSLYQSDSQLSILNRYGALAAPAIELLDLLNISARIVNETNGAFDPTIQPLWALYAQRYAAGAKPSKAEIADARSRVGFQNITVSPEMVSFSKPGMALTFNGIAQGYIADKVAQLLRREGVTDVLVNTGEINAIGIAPDGGAWPITLADQQRQLSNAAIATSAPNGTFFDQQGIVGHILDPRTGLPGGNWQTISVIDKSAARADGLSTAFCLMSKEQIHAVSGTHEVVFGEASS
ncbi:FAD:protein FMN transferase [Maritalea porphyrae]|uniref:FAD:protein FMN transferase n=1 Tax=Maritalea porphyrae TaxID=880732 RepID=A0ABQ5US66_9HYPH|nr:FAD:protein FMN transferase [Maritalea porphyrae]GLQ17226.1 FAD:protein FMN transferase [Maritalea porphyrae]